MQTKPQRVAGRAAGLIFSVLLGLLFSLSIQAAPQVRPLPANGILGTFQPSALPKIVIDGQVCVLSAGAQIRNQKNLIVQTGTISGPDVKVLYTKDRQGQLSRIWILTDAEIERINSGAPATAVLPGVK